MKYRTAYFAGYAKFPSNVSVNTIYSSFTLGVVISLDTGVITNADCTLITPMAREMVKDYLVGYNIVLDYDEMVQEITIRHQGVCCKAILRSLAEIHRKYLAFCEQYGIPLLIRENGEENIQNAQK